MHLTQDSVLTLSKPMVPYEDILTRSLLSVKVLILCSSLIEVCVLYLTGE